MTGLLVIIMELVVIIMGAMSVPRQFSAAAKKKTAPIVRSLKPPPYSRVVER